MIEEKNISIKKNAKIRDDFGQFVQQIRMQKKISLIGLQKRTSISADFIERIEQGQREAPRLVAELIAKTLKIEKSKIYDC